MKQLTENTKQMRINALLALTATKRSSVDSCPSPQQIALFIDGQINKKKRKQMLAHFNQCENCRNIWLETATYLESNPETNKKSIWQKTVKAIKGFMSRPRPLIIGGVTAALLILVVIIPNSNINQQIDSGYEMLSSLSNTEAVNVAKTLTMPWDNAVMTFSKTNNKPEKKAFGAGLWHGKSRLLSVPQPLPSRLKPPEQRHWQDTDWVSYYQFGRLVMLLWVESQLTTNFSDWNKHEKTLTQLGKNLADHPVNEELTQSILLSLQQIAAKIEGLKKQQNAAEKKPLQRLLEIIMQKYSPG